MSDHRKNSCKFVTTRGVYEWDEKSQRYVVVSKEGYWYEGPWALAHDVSPIWRAEDYRWRNDDGSISAATWIAAENTAITASSGDQLRLRVNAGEENGAAGTGEHSGGWTLQYAINGGTWTTVGAATDVRYFDSTNLTNGTAIAFANYTLNYSGASAVQRDWGDECEDGVSLSGNTWSKDFCEIEYTVDFFNVSPGDEITFRLLAPDGSTAVTFINVPTVTIAYVVSVAKGAAALSGKTPVAFRQDYVNPGEETLALAGQAPTISTSGPIAVAEVDLTLAGQAPSLDYNVPIVEDTLALTGQVLTAFRQDYVAPAVRALTFDEKTLILNSTYEVAYVELNLVVVRGLVLDTHTPTVSVTVGGDITRSPAEVDLVLAGKVPTVFRQDYVNPVEDDITLTGQAPSLTYSVPVAEHDLTLAGQAPTVFRQDNVAPAVVAATLAGQAPSTDYTISVGEDTLSLTSQAPSLFREYNVSPAIVNLTLTGQAPATNYTIPVTEATLTVTGQAPSDEFDYFITITVGALTLAGYAPEAGTGLFVSSGALTLAGQAPSVERDYFITISAGSLVLGTAAPTSDYGIAVTEGAATLAGQVPTAFRQDTVNPAAVSAALSGQAPSLDYTISVTEAAVALSGKVPDVLSGDSISPAAGALTLAGQVPTVKRDYFESIANGTLTFAGQAPTVTQQLNRAPAVSTVVLFGQTPSAELSYVVSPAASTLTLTGQSLLLDNGVALSTGTLALAGYAPAIPDGNITRAPASTSAALAGKIPVVITSAAFETLNIDNWNAGWPTGFVSNVDEAIVDADGQLVSTNIADDLVIFDLDDVSVVRDIDTVTSVTITIRSKAAITSSTPTLDVALRIGGVTRTAVATSTLTTSLTNETLTHATWDGDWTVAELNAAQVYVTSRQVTSEPFQVWSIDCIDVEVNYTLAPVFNFTPATYAAALTGQVPAAIETGGFRSARPASYSAALTPTAATLDSTLPISEVDLLFSRKKAYVNPSIEQLQVNVWDSGWPTGFVSNVDEPSQFADGQVISTSINTDVVTFGFDDLTSVVATDTILGISFVVRSKITSPGILTSSSLGIEVLVQNVVVATTTITHAEDVFVNTTIVDEDLLTDAWSVDDINTLQVRVTANAVGDTFVWSIDTIDALIEYDSPGSSIVDPEVGALSLTSTAPVITTEVIKTPGANALVAAGQAVTLFRQDTLYPDEVFRRFNVKSVALTIDFLMKPAAYAATFSLKAPTAVQTDVNAPASVSLALSGQAPTANVVANTVKSVAKAALILRREKPLVQTLANQTVQGAQATGVFAGQAPTVVQTRNIWIMVARRAITLSGKAPTDIQSQVRPVAAAVRTLTPQATAASISTVINIPVRTTTFTGYAVSLGPREAILTLNNYAVSLLHTISVPKRAVRFSTTVPVSEYKSKTPLRVRLTFSTGTPTLSFSTFLLSANPQLINLSTKRSLEFISTPNVL